MEIDNKLKMHFQVLMSEKLTSMRICTFDTLVNDIYLGYCLVADKIQVKENNVPLEYCYALLCNGNGRRWGMEIKLNLNERITIGYSRYLGLHVY